MALSQQVFNRPKLCLWKIKVKFKEQEIPHKNLEILASFAKMEDTWLTLYTVADGRSCCPRGWTRELQLSPHQSPLSYSASAITAFPVLGAALSIRMDWITTSFKTHYTYFKDTKGKAEYLGLSQEKNENLVFCVQDFLAGIASSQSGTSPA